MQIREQKVQLADGTLKTIYVKMYVPGEEQEIVEAVQEVLTEKEKRKTKKEPIMVLTPESDEVVPDPTDVDSL